MYYTTYPERVVQLSPRGELINLFNNLLRRVKAFLNMFVYKVGVLTTSYLPRRSKVGEIGKVVE